MSQGLLTTPQQGGKDEDWEPRLKKYPLFGSLVNFPLIAALSRPTASADAPKPIAYNASRRCVYTIKKIENRRMQVHKNVRMKQ